MLLPSLAHIRTVFFATLRRFPVELLVATVGTVCAIAFVILIARENASDLKEQTKTLTYVILSCVLSMSTVLALTILREGNVLRAAWYWLLVAGALPGFYWFTTYAVSSESTSQYLAACAAVHLFVAVSGIWKRSRDEFWEFNKSIFLRLLSAGIFTGALVAGTSAALASLDVLFDVKIDYWIYASNVAVFVGWFNTIHVLSGVPTRSPLQPFPLVLLRFTQYVLLPLVALFMIILYAYAGKVVLFSNLDGNVAGYVLAEAILGTLAYLLVYPLQTSENHRWIALFGRWFAVAMLPLTIMLWVAIGVRVAAYGVTEERYAVMALATCLSVVVLYLSAWRSPDIRFIPVVLLVVAVVAAIGPLNVRSVSVLSQLHRTEELLRKTGLVVSRHIQRDVWLQLPAEERSEILSQMRFTMSIADSTTLRDWMQSIADSAPQVINYDTFIVWLGVQSSVNEGLVRAVLPMDQYRSPKNIWARNGSVQPFVLRDYREDDREIQHIFYDSGEWVLRFENTTPLSMSITSPEGTSALVDLSKDLVLSNHYQVDRFPRGYFTYSVMLNGKRVRVSFHEFWGTVSDNTWRNVSAEGIILVERP